MKINYIPVFYFGIRRYNNPKDKFLFFKKHLEFISTLSAGSNIEASFVINKIDSDSKEEIKSVINGYAIDIPFEIIYRQNVQYSYGGWNDAIKKNINKNYDYSFLIEDDYIPTSINFYEPFLKEMNNDTAFVCTKVFETNASFPRHAAISNGLISNEKCKEVLQKDRDVFHLSSVMEKGYRFAETNQVLFLNQFLTLGFKLEQISDEFSKPFLDSTKNGTVEHGGTKDAPTVPIIVSKEELL
jgi:hypothetical protein